MMARAIENEHTSSERRPGRDRLRLLVAMDYLPAPEIEDTIQLGDLGFATLRLTDACTACGACARACPTGALSFERSKDAKNFSLKFSAPKCIDCAVCVHVCAPSAVEIEHAPTFAQVFSQDTHTLLEGSLAKCARCGAPIAERPNIELCPVCEFRRQSPFGSMLPAGLQHLAERAANRKAS